MLTKKTKLKEINNYITTDAILTELIIENSAEIVLDRKRPAIIVVPGGGYGGVSAREGLPVALKFVGEGYSAFILDYSVAPIRYPNQLLELSVAMSYVRANADEYNIDKDKIIVIGFSAGGHLAASLGTLYNEDFITDTLKIEKLSNRPNGMILSYAVLSSSNNGHKGSFVNLIGDENEDNKELYAALSLEKRVSKDTPKTFLWHTVSDTCVPVENSLLFAKALQAHKIPFEMHIFPEGVHGLSLCNELTACNKDLINPHCAQWFDLAIHWLKENF